MFKSPKALWRPPATSWQIMPWTWLVLVSAAGAAMLEATGPAPAGFSPLVQDCAAGSSLVQLASRALNAELLHPAKAQWPSRAFVASYLSEDADVASDRLSQRRPISKEPDQGADSQLSKEVEELGPAAAVLSTLELLLEEPNIGLSGPNVEGIDLQPLLLYSMVACCVAMMLMAVPFVGLGANIDCCGDLLGLSIKAGIQKFDRGYLGVDVEIGHLTTNPFDGYVDCEHLIVYNPPGYNSKYLLKASRVLLDIDMLTLMKTGMNKVSVECLVFKDIEAIYEKKWSTSNMEEVMNHINKATGADQADPEEDTTEYEIHRIEVKNVGVNVRPTGTLGEYVNINMEAGDVYYHDFNSEVGHTYVKDIVRELLKSLLKTVMSNVAGKRAGEYLT